MGAIEDLFGFWSINPISAIPVIGAFLVASATMLVVRKILWAWFAGAFVGFLVPYIFLLPIFVIGMSFMREVEGDGTNPIVALLTLPAVVLWPSLITAFIGAMLGRGLLLFR